MAMTVAGAGFTAAHSRPNSLSCVQLSTRQSWLNDSFKGKHLNREGGSQTAFSCCTFGIQHHVGAEVTELAGRPATGHSCLMGG